MGVATTAPCAPAELPSRNQLDEKSMAKLITSVELIAKKVAGAQRERCFEDLRQAGLEAALEVARDGGSIEGMKWKAREAMRRELRELDGRYVGRTAYAYRVRRAIELTVERANRAGESLSWDDAVARSSITRGRPLGRSAAVGASRRLDGKFEKGLPVTDELGEDSYVNEKLGQLGINSVDELLDVLSVTDRVLIESFFRLDGVQRTDGEVAGVLGVEPRQLQMRKTRALRILSEAVGVDQRVVAKRLLNTCTVSEAAEVMCVSRDTLNRFAGEASRPRRDRRAGTRRTAVFDH